jgi:hypothetical protein
MSKKKTKKKFISTTTTLDMPSDIIIDGQPLWHCMFKHGNKVQKKAQFEVQQIIIDLWNSYKSDKTSPKKKEEVKAALLFWERYLAEEVSGNLKHTPTELAADPEYRSGIWARRYARENDLLYTADGKRKFVSDEQHVNLHQAAEAHDIYDAKDAIRGVKAVEGGAVTCTAPTTPTITMKEIAGQVVEVKSYPANTCQCSSCLSPKKKRVTRTRLSKKIDELHIEQIEDNSIIEIESKSF